MPENLLCNLPKIQTKRPNLRVFRQKDANGIANSEDPDQTAPPGAVFSGSALFAQTYLSENFDHYGMWTLSVVCRQMSIYSGQSLGSPDT